jgi:hypothetical protein
MNPALALLTVFLVLTLPATAQEIGTLTLVEGPLRLIRGATVLRGAEGVRLHPGDIIESSDPGFVQLEFDGGTIVALGGSTRVLLFSHAAGRNPGKLGNAAELVLLSGWLKGESGPNAGTYRYDSPLLAVASRDGSLVVHSTVELAEIFVESGSARIGEVSAGGIWRDPRLVGAGQFSSRLAGKNVTISPRPSSPFVESMPHQFRDTVSPLRSRFAGKPPLPKPDHEVSYAEIQPWLTIAQAWRRGFVTRFEGRLSNPAFRKAVEAHLKDHPEWDPVIHPELYEPKTPSAAAGKSDPKSGRNQN